MKTTLIPIVPTTISGQPTQMVDARLLHKFLEVGRDFTNWIKGRIEEFDFEMGLDFVSFDSPNPANQVSRGGDRKSKAYFVTLDMAKELAMIERTAKGRQVRRYFLECERQLHQLQYSTPVNLTRQSVAISPGQRQAINRQAWADVSGHARAAFHVRREALLRQYVEQTDQPRRSRIPEDLRPVWAR